MLIGDYETEIQVNGSTEETFNQSNDATYDVQVSTDVEIAGALSLASSSASSTTKNDM